MDEDKKSILRTKTPLFLISSVMLFIFAFVIINVRADDTDPTYVLGSNATITYKKNENKVYYTRKHFSSGSGIRYYTQSFVISLREAGESDDLSNLERNGDYSVMYTVSTDGSASLADDVDRSLDFYWYDSEVSDDGYITTTYVIDGSVFINLLNSAALSGKTGSIYIHHVFAVTGGSNSDEWHRDNRVTNNSPFYRYSDLFKLWWNNTAATQASQRDCLNIPVPFTRFCDVSTAYYNEKGEIIKQENENIEIRNVWKKKVPYKITGSDGKEYKSVESGNMKDVNGNVMKAVYIWNTDPAIKNVFPGWNMQYDLNCVNGTTVRTKSAADSEALPGGYKNKKENTYNFSLLSSNAVSVILYIPVVENVKQPSPTPTSTPTPTQVPDTTPSPQLTPIPGPTPVLTATPVLTPGPPITVTPGITLTTTPTETSEITLTATPTETSEITPTATPTATPKLSVGDDNLKFVQSLSAGIGIAHAVTGLSDSYGTEGHLTDSCDFYLELENYDESVMVMFSCDMYSSDGIRIRGGTWNEPYPSYYVPADVPEGSYVIRAASFDDDGEIVFEDQKLIEVSGKLYGLELFDISSEAYDWKDVFRYEGVNKYINRNLFNPGIFEEGFNKEKIYSYGTGTKNELGLSKKDGKNRYMLDKYILPVVDGTGARTENTGMLKSGYTWSFTLKTSGSRMLDAASKIVIRPEFTHISKNGKRKAADIWYSDRTGGANDYFINLRGSFEAESAAVYAQKGIREWRFTFSIPDVWYCTAKGFDMDGYLRKYGGCSYREDFFLKEGYVAVKLIIEAYDRSGKLIMTYSNTRGNTALGMCDMWDTEGFKRERKDCFGQRYSLEEGEVILVRVPGSTYDNATGFADPPTNVSEENMIRRIKTDIRRFEL